MADTYTVERSTTIAAPAAAVYEHVADFHKWRSWSPWEDLDPELERTYTGPESGVGAKYAWSGNRKAGVGTMEIVEATPPSLVRIDLRFEKPFRAENVTTFTIEPAGETTGVTWTMTGRKTLGLKLFGLVKSMDSMVGPDFERGLASLKEAAEAP